MQSRTASNQNIQITPHPAPSLGARFAHVRAATERLARPLSPEDCVVQSMPDASPVKWHLAHTSWFFETFVLEPRLPGYRVFQPEFRFLFNSYYNAVGEQYSRPQRGLLTRPSLDAVLAYRAHVNAAMSRMFEASARIDPETEEIIELGLNHEQQHQELIVTDVKHLLASNPLRPAYRLDPTGGAAGPPSTTKPSPRWHHFEERLARIGHAGRDFAFDNETPRHHVVVPAFELASRPVTNSDYLEFIGEGGYSRPEFWLSDGWNEVRTHTWQAPMYWEVRDGKWWHYTLEGQRPVRLAEPVCHVSFYEADAYARWAGARLPTEFEWESAAVTVAVVGHFSRSARFHPTPAPLAHDGVPQQLFGDVWEWTASAYAAYPGYRPTAGALGEYNGKFMCNQLVLRGGSCATPRSHIRATYRNFFPPAARWQFSGFRLARDAG